MIAQAYERERLAAKIRLLVNRAYRRGRDREILRQAGYEVVTEPGSWDAFDDEIFKGYRPASDHGLRLLPGGGEDPVSTSGSAAKERSESRAAAYGDQPLSAVYRQPGERPSNFDSEEQR